VAVVVAVIVAMKHHVAAHRDPSSRRRFHLVERRQIGEIRL
jgi:ribosomal protein S15P/S13E